MVRHTRVSIFSIYPVVLIISLLAQPAWADSDKTTSRTTVNLITSLANSGRAEAQHALAHLYLNGDGVEQNYEKALEWFGKAADQGHADAQNNLGMMYADGMGVEQDCGRAQNWFNTVRQGNYIYQQAQANLAWLLATCPQAQYRNGQKALSISQTLLQQGKPDNANLLDTLAAAYAETGQFERASEIQQQAINLLPKSHGDNARLDRFSQRLQSYQTSKPWRNMGN